jgi:pyrroloquinoline quinone biosynthesis protein D
MMTADARPRLATKARLKYDRFSGHYLLLFPETGWLLNDTGMELLQLCDGRHSLGMILDVLARRYPHVQPDALNADVRSFLAALAERSLLRSHG